MHSAFVNRIIYVNIADCTETGTSKTWHRRHLEFEYRFSLNSSTADTAAKRRRSLHGKDLSMFSDFIRLPKLSYFIALIVGLTLTASTLATLNSGDIAIIGYQADNPDGIAFVVLQPVAAGEIIRFTDSGWTTSGSFRANEGGIAFTATDTLTPGTVITRSSPFSSGEWTSSPSGVGSGEIALSVSGDQIIVFQGNASSPDFVYAIHAGSSWGNATSSNTTAIPTGLTDGSTAVCIGNVDNGYYSGSTQGTAQQLLSAIGNSNNWTTSDSIQSWPTWNFIMDGQTLPSISDVSISGSTFDEGDPATVTTTLSETPESGSPATVNLSCGAFSVTPISVQIAFPNDSVATPVTLQHAGTFSIAASAVSACQGSATSATFSVEGATTPAPPTVFAGSDRTVTLTTTSITEQMTGATVTDPNGLSGVNYAWTPSSGTGISSWVNQTGIAYSTASPASAEVTFNAIGVYTFTLTATDPDTLFDTDQVTITVIGAPVGDEYDPPASYYDPARPGGSWYTGNTLRNALEGIIDNHVYRSYNSVTSAAAILDQDPNNPNNIILIYTGESVSNDWDGTWNREHMWPDSRNSNANDLFNIRPCDPSVNSSRGNLPYGEVSGYWDADQGAPHRGDSARIMFYMATRYSNLELVNGSLGSNEMGGLDYLIDWHYEDPVSVRERRMNHLLYSQADNPSYYQGNRNPFIDHPELVWAIWGDHPNNSQLYVGSSPASDGSSVATLNFGTVITGGNLGSAQSVTLHKTGTDPTYYNITSTGDVLCSAIGPRQAFTGGTNSRNLTVSLSANTAVAGLKTGSIFINNTDLTSAATGQGVSDGDDTIAATATVLDHSNASFDESSDTDSKVIDFGQVALGSSSQSTQCSVYNLSATAGYTADLDLDAINATGHTDTLELDMNTFSGLAPGNGITGYVVFSPVAPGSFEAQYTLSVSDEDIPGTQQGTPLTLIVRGEVLAPIFPFDDNGDGNIDLTDLQGFLSCQTLPGETVSPPCDNHDADEDGDVDLHDFAQFQLMFGNP